MSRRQLMTPEEAEKLRKAASADGYWSRRRQLLDYHDELTETRAALRAVLAELEGLHAKARAGGQAE